MNELHGLSFQQIINALYHAKKDGIVVDEVVMIPEADIALCQYQEKRFNVKFDLDYGVEIEAVDALLRTDRQFAASIAHLIIKHLGELESTEGTMT